VKKRVWDNDMSSLGRRGNRRADSTGSHGMCRLIPVVIACLAAICLLNVRADAASEAQVKAAFIYNFVRFVEWPAQSFPSSDTPVTIGVVGSEQIADAIEQITKGKALDGRKLVVKRLSGSDSLDGCHILFIGASQKGRMSAILDKLRDSSVLTIGETDGFVQSGGIIGFVIENSKVAFHINAGAAKKKHLRISSQLLRLARNVKD
jgi:hypothetical protein